MICRCNSLCPKVIQRGRLLYWLKEWKYVWRGQEGRTKWGDVEETKAAHCSWQLITTNCSESTRASVSIILYSRLTVSVIPGSRPQSADPPPSEEGSWTHWREKTQQQQQLITPAHHSQRAAISCLRWSGKNFEGLKTGTLAYLSSLSSDVWLSLLNVDISRYLPNKMWKSPRCSWLSLNVRGRYIPDECGPSSTTVQSIKVQHNGCPSKGCCCCCLLTCQISCSTPRKQMHERKQLVHSLREEQTWESVTTSCIPIGHLHR